MNNSLAPTYKKRFGEYWVLWYSNSNSYSIITSSFKIILDYYLFSDSLEAFKAKLNKNEINNATDTVVKTIHNYLSDCNRCSDFPREEHLTFDSSNRNILKQYIIQGLTIQIYFDSDLVLKTVHPSLAHLSTKLSDDVKTTFDIFLKNDNLYLFRDEQLITCVPKRDYHLLQGKFIMQLLCTIHDKNEDDWVGTFHGSTITDGNTSILFVGESGKGKSTLCALLTAQGFGLLADDVSPMLSANKHIYYNPSAISIKEGAFNVLQQIVPNFDLLPIVQFNKTKGPLRYLPCSSPKKYHYSCKAIVLVNYKSKAKTHLDEVSIKTLLETLIPDSWLSPKPIHAKQFLDWLDTVNIYKLTYSDTKSVNMEISELFEQLNKN